MTNALVLALAGVGSTTILFLINFMSRFFHLHFVRPSHPLEVYKRGNVDAYALVTGSSVGIGLGISQELVRQGFHIILLGHLRGELDEAAATLRAIRPDVEVRILVLNAQTASPAIIKEAVQPLADLNVTVLANNVGGIPVARPLIRRFDTYTVAEVDAIIDMNARFMARLTLSVLPLLSRRSTVLPNRRSLILNIASGGMCGVPWVVVYGATKSFNWSFSSGLARELQTDPSTALVDCLAVVPGEVRSQSNNIGDHPGDPLWDEFGTSIVLKADNALRQRCRVLRPHWKHDIQLTLLDVLPERARTWAVTEQMRQKRDEWNDWFAQNPKQE